MNNKNSHRKLIEGYKKQLLYTATLQQQQQQHPLPEKTTKTTHLGTQFSEKSTEKKID